MLAYLQWRVFSNFCTLNADATFRDDEAMVYTFLPLLEITYLIEAMSNGLSQNNRAILTASPEIDFIIDFCCGLFLTYSRIKMKQTEVQ